MRTENMETITDLNVIVNGLSISYTDEGDHSHNTVVFIHGFPLNKAMWNNQREALRNNYRVITYDLRGFGDSEAGTEQLSMSLFAADLENLLQSLEVHKAILCGFSMGGYIALTAADKFPNLFEALILCDTQCNSDTAEGRAKRIKSIEAIRLDGLELYADDSLAKFFYAETHNKKSKEIIEVRRMIEGTPIETVCETLMALANRPETCSTLERIKMPVMILVGNEDTITPPEKATFMQRKIKGSTLYLLENAAHLSNLDNPTDFNKHLITFLDKVTQKGL